MSDSGPDLKKLLAKAWLSLAALAAAAVSVVVVVLLVDLKQSRPAIPTVRATAASAPFVVAAGCKSQAIESVADATLRQIRVATCDAARREAETAARDAALSAREADLAVNATRVAAWQGDIAFGALVLAALTLLAALAAAIYAARAAKASEDSSRTAAAGLKLAQDSARQDLRPYVYIGTIETRLRGAGSSIMEPYEDIDLHGVVFSGESTFVFKNFGKSPARNVRLNFWTDWHPRGDLSQLRPAKAWTSFDLPPGGEYRQPFNVGGLSEKYERMGGPLALKRESFYLFFQVGYTDAFGEYRDTFIYELSQYGRVLWEQRPEKQEYLDFDAPFPPPGH